MNNASTWFRWAIGGMFAVIMFLLNHMTALIDERAASIAAMVEALDSRIETLGTRITRIEARQDLIERTKQ